MARNPDEFAVLSRRAFLRSMGWAPALFLAAPFQVQGLPTVRPAATVGHGSSFFFPLADSRLTPHYPSKAPLDDVLRRVTPGLDEYVTETYALEITEILSAWSTGLRATAPDLTSMARFLAPSIAATPLHLSQQVNLRSGVGIEVWRRRFVENAVIGRDRFLEEITAYLAQLGRIETAELQIVGIEEGTSSSPPLCVDIRYDLVGVRIDASREERIGM